MEAADFSGYATKAGLKCSDGRTITSEAFKHMDGMTVPLVWQHGHNDPKNVLGHAVLKALKDGMYAYGFFNDTDQGNNARKLVQHKDVKWMSIFANQLVEKSKQVLHGEICEVSLVIKGANPGALIDFVAIRHADGNVELFEDEAVIYTGLEFEHSDEFQDDEEDDEELEHADPNTMTIQDIYDSLTDVQKNVVHYLIGAAVEGPGDSVAQSAIDEDAKEEETAEGDLAHSQEGTTVSRNVFDQTDQDKQSTEGKHVLSHDAIKGLFESAAKRGSMKLAVQDYCLAHNINDVDILFPDAKNVMNTPEWDKRRTEWVAGVLGKTRHTPFTRIKSIVADLTLEVARARGYVKGNLKKEEFFGLVKRTTGPTTVYKKQKLDRDDILDITDFDVVAWMKGEMRLMLEEELARAILIGDGRAVDDDDKIKDPVGAADGNGIRSIVNDDDLYTAKVYVNLDDASSNYLELVDAIIRTRRLYKGTGLPCMYTTETVISNFLTLRDSEQKRMYRNIEELATELRVSDIVAVEVMEDETDLLAILVNLQDYNIGTDQGGEVSLFDDFDLDYNQFKYLIETRVSGALVKIRSALAYFKTGGSDVLATPTEPAFVANVITVPTITGVTYKRADTDATVTTGSPITLNNTTLTELTIYAVPATGYFFENNVDDQWTFTFEA